MVDYYHDVAAPESVIVDWNVGGYPVRVPKFLADRQGNKYSWEAARFRHMSRHLKPGMVLFDVGAEQGYMSAIYATMVGGGENMVLFEPVPQSWPNIRTIWAANHLATPKFTYCGFISDKSHVAWERENTMGYRDGWPECAYDHPLLDATKFKYEGEHWHCTDSMSLDTFMASSYGILPGVIPDAITVDVEGYEPVVIAGAMKTITTHRPLIWLSLHKPEQNNILYAFTGNDHLDRMHQSLLDAGYAMEFIADDHERHVAYFPIERG